MLLKTENLTLKFGGLVANNQVNIMVEEGSITGLIGPNGAGKTTLFNLINGVYAPTSGKIYFDGKRIDGCSLIRSIGPVSAAPIRSSTSSRR